MNILLADDNDSFRDVTEKFLVKLKHKVIAADNGLKALSLYQEEAENLDLVITDIIMPEMSGLELTRSIREHNALMPIIIISGFAQPDIIRKALELNTTIYEKPVDFGMLRSHIESLSPGIRE